ncbi:MAG: protein kinase [Sandaracinaceae bacterium]
MLDPELEDRVDALVKVGRHDAAADLCLAHEEPARASELYAAVWKWDEAMATAELHGLFDLAYRHALAAQDREATGRLLLELESHPEQAVRAANYAERKGLTLDAARLREVAGEAEAAAVLYERASEYRDAARCRLTLGQSREAGMLFEKRLREDPADAESALALGRILAQFGRWDHAVRSLQRSVEDPVYEAPSLRLLVACFSAMGMDDAAGSRLDALRRLEPDLPMTVSAFLEAEFGDKRGAAALVGEGAGDRFLGGRYRVLEPLGAGATGRVLLAHDAFHDREVAVKVLNVGGGSAGRDAFVRFAREARVAAGISHPNVVSVFEFNADGPYLVMELMAGGTLSDRIDPAEGPRPFPPVQTWHVARSVLMALEAVHRRGVVHRDLKPANIFFGKSGDVKLGDFGVAHLQDLGSTLTGAMVGTLAFMAPEQITGSRRPNASTDLYAFAVILFRCLTGRLPFEGPDFVEQHLEATPPVPSEVAPWLGTHFDALIASLLEKDAAKRPGSATGLLEQLRGMPWTTLEPDASNPEPAPRRAFSEPPPDAEGAERFRPTRQLSDRVTLAFDELLERSVQLVDIDAAAAARLLRYAGADHPFLQAVYEVDALAGRAVLEHPTGASWSALPETDPRRSHALMELRHAIARLHEHGVAHGSVDADHVVLGSARSCLLLPLDALDSGRETTADWEGLDRLGGHVSRTR